MKERGEGMGGSTAIASVIEKNEIGKAYYEYCKKILCNKQILSYIIKECILEFADISLQEIPYYIESNPVFDVIVILFKERIWRMSLFLGL